MVLIDNMLNTGSSMNDLMKEYDICTELGLEVEMTNYKFLLKKKGLILP